MRPFVRYERDGSDEQQYLYEQNKAQKLYSRYYFDFMQDSLNSMDVLFTTSKILEKKDKTSLDENLLRVLLEMCWSRAVARFVIYLSDVLIDIFERNPKLALRMKEGKISYNQISMHATLDDLLEEICADVKIVLKDKKALPLLGIVKAVLGYDFVPEKDHAMLDFYTTVRNAICHNGGRIDDDVIKKATLLPGYDPSKFVLGEKLSLEISDITLFCVYMVRQIARMEHFICDKFGVIKEKTGLELDAIINNGSLSEVIFKPPNQP